MAFVSNRRGAQSCGWLLPCDLPRHKALRRRGIVLDRDRPAAVTLSKLAEREPPPARQNHPDKMNTAVACRSLQQLDRPRAFVGGQSGKGCRSADHRAERGGRLELREARDSPVNPI